MKKYLKYAFYLFLPIILGSLVGFLISGKIDYMSLKQPLLAPPKLIFPIAWSIIYLLMGLSFFLLKRDYPSCPEETLVYYIQLFVNLLWSIIFFLLKWRLFAIIWIILLDILVIYMIYLFFRRKRISAYLNIPYLIWILFATYLTIGIYVLN